LSDEKKIHEVRRALQDMYKTMVHIPIHCIDCKYDLRSKAERDAFDSTLADIFVTSKIFEPYDLT